MDTSSGSEIRLLVIDDDPGVCQALMDVAEGEDDITIIGMASTSRDGIRMAQELRPDAVLVDHSLPPKDRRGYMEQSDISGLEAVGYLKDLLPASTIVLFTGRPGMATSAAKAGADLYIEKGGAPQEVLARIRAARSPGPD